MRRLIVILFLLAPAGAWADTCDLERAQLKRNNVFLTDRVAALERQNKVFRDANDEAMATVSELTLDGIRDLETIGRLKTAIADLEAKQRATEAKVPSVCAAVPRPPKGPVKTAKRKKKRKPVEKTFEQTMADLIKNGYTP